jgi:CRP-like cAMP-binding protein
MHILLRKLTALHDLSEEEQTAVLSALTPSRDVVRGQDIVTEGGFPSFTTVMLSGTACRYKVLSSGKRHILTFQYPGDMTDLYSYVMKRVDHAVGALATCSIAQIPHEKIGELCVKYPNLAYAFWRDTMVDGSILYSWAMGAARSTSENVAHLLCEIAARLKVVGITTLDEPLPFGGTQRDLADALGLSLVHLNKTLARLRKKNLVTVTGGRIQILDWEGLKAVANFDPAYLHFKQVHRLIG